MNRTLNSVACVVCCCLSVVRCWFWVWIVFVVLSHWEAENSEICHHFKPINWVVPFTVIVSKGKGITYKTRDNACHYYWERGTIQPINVCIVWLCQLWNQGATPKKSIDFVETISNCGLVQFVDQQRCQPAQHFSKISFFLMGMILLLDGWEGMNC